MELKKPSDLFGKKEQKGTVDNGIQELANKPEMNTFSDAFDSFKNNLNNFEAVSEKVENIQSEIQSLLKKEDLDRALMSQLLIVESSIRQVQDKVKSVNEETLYEIRSEVTELTNIVGNLLEVEFPKYKKQITKNEIVIGDKVDQIKEVVEENIVSIRQDLDSKIEEIAEVIDNNNDYVNQQLEENLLQVKETKKIYSNLSKIVENRVSQENEKLEEYSQTIENIQESFNQLSSLLKKELFTSQQDIEEKIQLYKEEVFESQRDIEEKFNQTQNQVSDFIDTSIENYRKELTSAKINRDDIERRFDTHKEEVEEEIQLYKEEIKEELSSSKEEIQLYKEEIKEELFVSQKNIEEKIQTHKQEINETQNQLSVLVDTSLDSLENYRKELVDVKADVVINEQYLKDVESYIKENYSQIVELREEVFEEIEKLPVGNLQENIQRLENKIDYIRETYSKIEPEVVVREVIKEGLLNEPPETKNSDPLTPLNQNFVTLDQLQQHYRLFINRIQQQLSTLGGGGETRLRYLDDVVGIATNSGSYNNMFLQWNSSTNKAEFVPIVGGEFQVNIDWNATSGITSILNKPTIPAAQVSSDWNATSGITSILNKPSPQDLNTTLGYGNTSSLGMSVGISTFNDAVVIGGGTTDLLVLGDARITGTLSIGTSSIVLDGSTNIITIGSGVTIYPGGAGNYSGVVTATAFIKTGGTSEQFLKADGSVDTSTYATTEFVGLATAGLASINYVNNSVTSIGLTSLIDVDVPTIADNKYLKYNETTGKFDFKYLNLSDFSIDIDGGVSSTIHEPLEFIVAEGGNASTNFYQTDLTLGGGGA